MKPTAFIPAFAQPIAIYDLVSDQTLNQALTDRILTLRSDYEHSPRTNVGGWRNQGNFFADRTACVQQLASLIKPAVISFLQSCQAELPLEKAQVALSGWANVNEQGHYNAPHRHLGADVCGCYYLSQPDSTELHTGNIEFLDNRNVIPQQQRFGGPVFKTSIQLRPNVGQLVVFPSFLTHWVPPIQSNEQRIVIAWNATVRTLQDRQLEQAKANVQRRPGPVF